MRGLRRSVRIIECSDNRSSGNLGFTIYGQGVTLLFSQQPERSISISLKLCVVESSNMVVILIYI